MTNNARPTFACCIAVALLGACLDPSPNLHAGYSSELIAAADAAQVPLLESDDVLRARLDANDGLEMPFIPLRSGFVGQQVVHYWDFGVTPAGAKPMWIFRRRTADGRAVDVGHYALIDSIPGDTGYTPFRMVYTVFVTDAYAGEKITSVAALEDALELGLLEEPQWKDTYANWPVGLAATELDMGPDREPMHAEPVYYRGKIANHFNLEAAGGPGAFSVEKGPIPTPNVYLLRRQNEAKPLDEVVWKLDLDDDGDTTDTNIVFSLEPGAMGNTSLWKQFDVVVPSDYVWATSRAENELFIKEMWGLTALPGKVVEYGDSMLLLNRAMQRSLP